ncbi:unnamed protein product [Effrenium voratum]|nr:unnamed protein product [Effrenium voratum]
MLSVDVCLPSGSSGSIAVVPEMSVRDLKSAAQQLFRRRFLRLIFGGRPLELWDTLSEAGLRNGDRVDAVALPVRLASTGTSFALHVEGGAALAWGEPDHGGDSSQVRELARVQQIQAASDGAFAAIRDDGSW